MLLRLKIRKREQRPVLEIETKSEKQATPGAVNWDCDCPLRFEKKQRPVLKT